MIGGAREILEEFAAVAHPATTRRDGRFVQLVRPSRPTADVVEPIEAVVVYETHRKIAARIEGRRIARRRAMWVPT